jgi:hypothetical protein
VGRYGQSNLSGLTSDGYGALSPIHNVSGLLTAEVTPTARLTLYLYYGGDYAGREDYGNSAASTLGAPSLKQSAAGVWGGTWGTISNGLISGATPNQPVGYGSRLLSNTACNTIANPSLNGSSTGFYPGGSCGAQTRDVQEVPGGYWYDIFKGDHGRLRQGVQYGYGVREGWSGAGSPAIGAKGIDNMFWTTFRYYLP